MQLITIGSDPQSSIIILVQDEESKVTRSLSDREIIEQVRMLYSDVILVNSLWNDPVKDEDHANATLMIHSMEVEVDTIQEEDIELHRMLTKRFDYHEVILRDNCITEVSEEASGIIR